MRVPDLIFHKLFTSRNAKTREEIRRAHEKIATGKRITRPSQDPPSAHKAVGIKRERWELTKLAENRSFALSVLTLADTTLGSIHDRLKSLYASAIRASGDLLTQEELKAVGEEFKRALETLLSLSNQRFGDNYLFSGASPETKPFDENLNYAGLSEEFYVLIDKNYRSAVFLNGNEVFGNITHDFHVYDITLTQGFDNVPDNDDVSFVLNSETVSGDSLEELLLGARQKLGDTALVLTYEKPTGETVIRIVSQSPISVLGAKKTSAEEVFLDNVLKVVHHVFVVLSNGEPVGEDEIELLKLSADRVSYARAKVGASMRELEHMRTYQEIRRDILDNAFSELVDADIAFAVSDYERYRLAYEAVMRLYDETRKLTILAYI
ncbi:MAG: flagellar hook-associated protein 3 [Aquificae bacterium]|nr:flagellar hook-associated protein 3 [Aquificota bacterium]